MRCCEKSTILELFQKELKASGITDQNIISINFESLDEEYPTEAKGLYDYIVARLGKRGTTYVFLDEIQRVSEFEKAVDGLFVRDDIDLYVTGSSAYYLSGELATLLTGRYVELQMFPLSFKEYLGAFDVYRTDIEKYFDRYLTYGGLPLLTKLDSSQEINEYLNGVFNTILVKDISRRHPQMNFQLFKARKYNLKGKEHLRTTERKYYLGDLGFRFWLLGKNA